MSQYRLAQDLGNQPCESIIVLPCEIFLFLQVFLKPPIIPPVNGGKLITLPVYGEGRGGVWLRPCCVMDIAEDSLSEGKIFRSNCF